MKEKQSYTLGAFSVWGHTTAPGCVRWPQVIPPWCVLSIFHYTESVLCVCVCWLFIFKDTEPSPLQDSSSVRQQGGLRGPPPVVPDTESLAAQVCVCVLVVYF